MASIEPFVTRAEDTQRQNWDDARGRISFHTLISGEVTPSAGLVSGVAIVEPGGSLAPHAHAQPEIYFVLEGSAVVTVDGVDRTLSPGAALFIPGNARHAIGNPFEAAFRFLYVFPADRFDQIVYDFATR